MCPLFENSPPLKTKPSTLSDDKHTTPLTSYTSKSFGAETDKSNTSSWWRNVNTPNETNTALALLSIWTRSRFRKQHGNINCFHIYISRTHSHTTMKWPGCVSGVSDTALTDCLVEAECGLLPDFHSVPALFEICPAFKWKRDKVFKNTPQSHLLSILQPPEEIQSADVFYYIKEQDTSSHLIISKACGRNTEAKRAREAFHHTHTSRTWQLLTEEILINNSTYRSLKSKNLS